MTRTTVTIEAIAGVADLKAGYMLGHADVAILKALATELLAVREAQSKPAPIAFSENADADMCRTWAWEQVKKDVTTDSWTIGDSGNFYGFYCWGWDMRRQYNEQRPPAVPDGYKLVPAEPNDDMIAAAMMCDDVEFNSDETFCVNFGNIYSAMLAAAPTPTKAVNESVPSLLKRNKQEKEQISKLLNSIPPIKLPEIMEIAEDATKETRHLIRSRNYLIESIAWLLRYQGLKVEGFPDEIPGKEKS